MLRLVTEVQPAGMTEAHQGSPGGCVSKFRPSWGNSTQGCLLRVQMWAVGRSQEVSSRVPPRTLRTVEPGLGAVQTHMPHSGHIQRVDTRPLPVGASADAGIAEAAVLWVSFRHILREL